MLNYKPAESCAFDALSLGEIMLRFDPGAGRIHTTRNFQVWEGGGEYNVVRGLRLVPNCLKVLALLVSLQQMCWSVSLSHEALPIYQKEYSQSMFLT